MQRIPSATELQFQDLASTEKSSGQNQNQHDGDAKTEKPKADFSAVSDSFDKVHHMSFPMLIASAIRSRHSLAGQVVGRASQTEQGE